MRLQASIGCETCSCGSVDDIVFEAAEGLQYDYECDNCGDTFAISIQPVADDTPLGLMEDEDE